MSTILAPTEGSETLGDAARVLDVDLPDSLSSVTFCVPATARLFLVGPRGSGRSQLLDYLSFRKQPARGRVQVLGVETARLDPRDRPRERRRLGQIFADDHLLPSLDVFTNIALSAVIVRRRARDYAPEIDELLSWVGLAGRGGDAITNLTEGEQRRVCLARALINRPELLIAEDPVRGLGEKAKATIMRHIVEINEAGTPIVFATSDHLLAARTGGAIYHMPTSAID